MNITKVTPWLMIGMGTTRNNIESDTPASQRTHTDIHIFPHTSHTLLDFPKIRSPKVHQVDKNTPTPQLGFFVPLQTWYSPGGFPTEDSFDITFTPRLFGLGGWNSRASGRPGGWSGLGRHWSTKSKDSRIYIETSLAKLANSSRSEIFGELFCLFLRMNGGNFNHPKGHGGIKRVADLGEPEPSAAATRKGIKTRDKLINLFRFGFGGGFEV